VVSCVKVRLLDSGVENVNPIVQLAASALPGEKKYILFAGAGVSKDAGVPTAWDLMLETAKLLYCADGCSGSPSTSELSEWFLSSKYAATSYADLIGTVYPSHPEQQAFLARFLSGYKPGESHKLIAELVRREIIRAIVTTNFDSFIEQALEALQIPVQVISNDDDLEHSEPLIHCKAIRVYKPHGTLGRGALRNTPEDLKQLSKGMEDELVRVLGEHGVLIVGYSGSDPGILSVLEARRPNWYPLFWADPSKPTAAALQLIEARHYQYLPCTGASALLREYLQLVDRLGELAPAVGHGPTLYDLENSLKNGGPQVSAVWKDYVTALNDELEATRPDFSKFTDYDDAIVAQIERATATSIRFAEAAILAGRYSSEEAARTLYMNFGKLATYAELPEGFSGTFREADFDGFKFVSYEMLVMLTAALMRYERWEILARILNERIFISRQRESEYVSFAHFSSFGESLDDLRNRRLKLNLVSVTGEMLNARFTKGRLAKLMEFKEVYEADYLLYLHSVVHETGESLWDTWAPRSVVYANYAPSFLAMAESGKFFRTLSLVCGIADIEEFKAKLAERFGLFARFFRRRNPFYRGFHFDTTRFGAID
jgi:SIR2-like domain